MIEVALLLDLGMFKRRKSEYMARRQIEIEEVFRNNIVSHIKGSFLTNVNLEIGGYHANMHKYDILTEIKRLANQLLEEIARTEHLILDNGVKELQSENEKLKLENALLRTKLDKGE